MPRPTPTRLDLRGGPLRWRRGSGGGLFAGVVLPLLALMASLGAVQSFVLGGSNSKLALRAASNLGGGGGGSGGEIGDVDEAYLGGGGPLRQLQLRYSCDDVDNEELSELLFECGVLSVSVEGESERPEVLNDEKLWGDLQKTKSWASALVRANFPASFDIDGLREILTAAFPGVPFEVDVVGVADKDWVSEVQQGWKPQIINDLTIRFPWHAPGETTTSKELVLEGGAAFGTGDHPTTRLCTRWLSQAIAERGSAGQGAAVLDYGCGSAILGLAALRYGAASATGVDIDKDALASAQNNCALNGLVMDLYLAKEEEEEEEGQGQGERGRGPAFVEAQSRAVAMNTLRGFSSDFPPVERLTAEGRTFDLVVANILAPILIALAPALAQLTKPGGKIALSGLVDRQAATVVAAFAEHFENVRVVGEEESWVCIEGTKGKGEGKGEGDSWGQFLEARLERAC